MNPKKLLIIGGIILFIWGCSNTSLVGSFNPFYIEKDVVMFENIEGIWNAKPLPGKNGVNYNANWRLADTSSWKVKQYFSHETIKNRLGKDSIIYKPQKYYIVKLLDTNNDSAQYQFKLVLFRVNNTLYGDFSPFELQAIQNSRMARENYLTIHTLARIEITNNKLHLSWLGSGTMKEMIERKRVRIKYRFVPDAERLLLTASSEELTQMIEKYGHQTRFIDWEDQSAKLQLTRLNQQP